jgi:MFS transporter, Spinster family, sphingosine-1-phosphate transporter
MRPSPAGPTRAQAYAAVGLLFGVNFLNYIDRYVIAAVAALIQKDFGLHDAQLGLIGSMFMVAYMGASPIAGILADRFPRRWFVAGGVLVWSLATLASGLSRSYHQLLAARSFIGIGEAGFGGVAPTLISDLFAKERRGRMLAYFYVAIPVGSALGFLLGGCIGQHHGWQTAFLVAGAPGIVLGLLAFRMYEPPRGAGDGVVGAEHRFELQAAKGLLRNASFLYTTLGLSAMTFALGGMAFWFPTFFSRVKGLPLDEANTLFGGMTVASGLIGTFLGGWLGDRLLLRTPKAYLLVSGWGMLLAVPFTILGLAADAKAVYVPAIFVAQVLVFLNTGPANAVLVNVVLPEIRATAISLSIFAYHLLGDVPSPILIGRLSDFSGSLETALMLTSAAMVVSGALYLYGARTLGEDTERVARTVAEREASLAMADAQGSASAG